MCGFVGFTNHIDNSNVVLGEMLDKIKHRGRTLRVLILTRILHWDTAA